MTIRPWFLVSLLALACDVPSSAFDGRVRPVTRDERPDSFDASVGCQSSPPRFLTDLPGAAQARVAFVGEAVAVAFVTDAGSVAVRVVDPTTGAERVRETFRDPAAANLALGTSGGVLGVAWDSWPSGESNHVRFATVDTVSGAASAPSRLSPRLGDSQEPVRGRTPRVSSHDAGFFVVWDDGRYAEPRRGGANLFGWQGLYGHAVDLAGEPEGSDKQIVQTADGTRSFALAWTGTDWLTVWSAGDSPVSVSGRFSGQGYTPAGEPPPLAVVAERKASGVIHLATGGDGRVLAAVPFASPLGARRLGTLVVSRTGTGAFTAWPELGVGVSALAGGPTGYVALTIDVLWQLDLDGRRLGSQQLSLEALRPGFISDTALSVEGKRARLLFTSETAAGVSIWSAVACLP
ncbi:MAG: hypothetical protein Q8L14_26955 [Myxococcales bacterium]|nr:hypothetical protein [Myxococcales bacterium]